MEGGIAQDHHALLTLPNQPLQGVLRDLGGGTTPRPPPLVEQQTPFPADNPAMIRKACAADLSRAPTLPNGVDQLHARGINDAQPRRGGQEGLRPGLMGPEEAKEPGPCR